MNKRYIWTMLLCCLLPIIGLVARVLAWAGIPFSPTVGALLMSPSIRLL